MDVKLHIEIDDEYGEETKKNWWRGEEGGGWGAPICELADVLMHRGQDSEGPGVAVLHERM
jgi:hypothetical protein